MKSARTAFLAFVSLLLASTAHAQTLLKPSPDLAPEDVVRTQLEALRDNDTPSPDHGIRQVWEFAHPANKRMTGPLERFSRMLKGQSYGLLLGHLSHKLKVIDQQAISAAIKVDVVSRTGVAVSYLWVLERAYGAGLDGAWMTVSVSIPAPAGREI